MRKLLLFALIVIVLVSLNWFKSALAQDLSNLSPAEIEQLKEAYKNSSPTTPPPPSNYYESPDIYESDSLVSATTKNNQPDSTISDSRKTIDNRTGFEAQAELTPFEELRPFGMELFRGSRETNPPADIASADDYMLGPGDNVLIYLWGRVEKEYNLTLDRNGRVFIPKVGDVVAWGLTVEQFTERVRKHLSSIYSEFDLTVSLGKIRSMRIYVTGEVRHPGAYTVSSLTSVLNAVFAAGGPNERGSMRKIAVMRNGEPVAVIDLYDLLLRGNNASDIRLRTGDAVFVPVAGERVAIRGEIKRSAIYELKGGETITELLALAGNPTPSAYLERVLLECISESGEWNLRDLDLRCYESESCEDIAVSDGDRITIYSIFEMRRNLVAVFGHVKHPGYYERTDTTRVSSLITRGGLRPYNVYFDRADIFRQYSDGRIEVIAVNLTHALAGDPAHDILLSDRDSVHVYSIDNIEREKFVYIEGEIARPGEYPLYDGMTVQDLIFLAGSYTRSASRSRGELARVDSLGSVVIEQVDLTSPNGLATMLQEDDHLYIRQIPHWRKDRSVAIAGEVVYPGTYWLTDNTETLYHLLRRAGGFTANAFPKGIVFERRSIEKNLTRLNVPALLDQSQPILLDSTGRTVREEIFSYRPESMNRIIIDIETILNSDGREGNVVMEPGDKIYVPPVPSGIPVMGAVGANGTLKYTEGRRVKEYIKRAGDFTRQADKGGTRLIRAGGEVLADGSVLGKKVELGDIIVVPSEIKRDRNWLKTASTVVTAATGIITSAYLMSKL